MNARDDLLRAAVWQAFADRDANGGRTPTAAAEQVVFVHRTFPLIEAELAIERAREELVRRRAQDEAELFAWYRSIGLVDDRELTRVG